MLRVQPIRVYADTSVYGGVFDQEFASPSTKLFDEVRSGRFQLVIGSPVRAELEDAPAEVRDFFDSIVSLGERADADPAAIGLSQAYLAADVVGPGSAIDALHVAIATLSRCEILVSWNFKHIVHRDKAPRYNAVNTLHDLPRIAIHSPSEVISYDETI
jgi:hypothetical protein